MTTLNEPKLLTHSEVHKKIIAQPPRIRPYEDQIGPYGRYNDENYEIYLKKKKQFEEARKKYMKMNDETLKCFKTRLHAQYMAGLDLDFIIEDNIDESKDSNKNNHNPKGEMINKRSVRQAHYTPPLDEHIPCNLEPWFRRYLILNKFIWAARKVLIKNRLLRNLDTLKSLDKETVKIFDTPSARYRGSYRDIFEKFI